MNTKLTLTIEKEVIESAKKYAREKGQSLSGMIKSDQNTDYKQILTEELSKKYGI